MHDNGMPKIKELLQDLLTALLEGSKTSKDESEIILWTAAMLKIMEITELMHKIQNVR